MHDMRSEPSRSRLLGVFWPLSCQRRKQTKRKVVRGSKIMRPHLGARRVFRPTLCLHAHLCMCVEGAGEL